jgi:hypothetical protein
VLEVAAMIYLAFASLAVAALTALALASVVRSLVRQQARERDLLLNQIMHLSGRTWTPPPAQREPRTETPRETIRNLDMLPEWELAEL